MVSGVQKKYIIGLVIGFLVFNFFFASTKADGTYPLSPNQALRKDFQGKAGEKYTWKLKFELYGSLYRLILNQSQYENRELLIYESECYSKTSFAYDAGLEKSGSFTVPYDDTWHIYWVNKGLYPTVITLYDWTKTSPSDETIGINSLIFLLGFIAAGVFLMLFKTTNKNRIMLGDF